MIVFNLSVGEKFRYTARSPKGSRHILDGILVEDIFYVQKLVRLPNVH